MKKSSLIIITVLVALIAASVLIFKKKGNLSTLDEDSRNFKYTDTASITKIFMADKNGRQCTLNRTKEGWVVNDKFKVRSDAILTLLETIKRVEVKRPVARQAKVGTLKVLAYRSIKVEIYSNDDLVKQYYVGHETPDGEGTHMLLTNLDTEKNYDDPYVVFIPGFTGFLNTRYIVEEKLWRDLNVINFTPDKLKKIQFTNLAKPDSSFAINIVNTKQFALFDFKNQQLTFPEMKMKQYLSYFQNLNAEAIFTSTDKHTADSLGATKPFSTFMIVDNNDKQHLFEFFRKYPNVTKNADYGVLYKYDPDRLYVRFDNKKEWAVIQYYVFGKLFITPQYFQEDVTVKN